MRILVACEFSGTVRDAFLKRGHDAMSCDLLPTEAPGPHYEGSVLDILDDGWDMMIAHPPCTYLSNSGVCHLSTDPSRWGKMKAGAEFFRQLLTSIIPLKCIENPIPHGHALEIIGRKYFQIIQPYEFGHPEMKPTCLWLEGLMPLRETDNVKDEMLALPKNKRQRIHYLSPGPDRWKERSLTFPGVANAMAEQWG